MCIQSRLSLYLQLLVVMISFTSCNNKDFDFIEELQSNDITPFYKDTITIAHWNIGHFSAGRTSDTTISSDDAAPMALTYKNLIDSINADILGICEYNPSFSVNGEKTSSFIFNQYPYHSIGNKYSYNCNAIFSKAQLNDSKLVFFDYCVQQRYYIVSKLFINGKEVLFVETHLDWNQGTDGKKYRIIQIQTLVDSFKDYPYVIICGDMNITSLNELQPFKDAGFILANGGDLGVFETCPASNPSNAIDNIITKGFDILSTNIFCKNILSDHCLINCKIIIQK